MGKLIFYDKEHEYELNGEIVPSVSELSRFASREIYGDVNQYLLDNAAERGSKVHKQCELLDKYRECEADEITAPYIQAYVNFIKDNRPEWVAIEKAMASNKMLFAGTLDRVGMLNGKRVIVDIKTSSAVQKVLALIQLNAYKMLWEENHTDEPIEELYILHLTKEGKYKLINFDIDNTLFMACYNLHQALKKKKRKRRNDNE